MTVLLRFRKFFAANLCFIILSGCTETSSVNQIDNPRRDKISGRIGLSPGVSPESIYVWLGKTALKTYTDKTGAFELTLPASGRVPPFNVTASFDLYFYLANSKLSSTPVFVAEGQFLYSRGEIGRDGGILFKNLDTGSISVYAQDGAPGRRVIEKIGREPFEFEIDFPFQPDVLTPGRYEAIPYFLIEQENMAAGLLASLGENVEALGPGFLKIPIRRKGGQFVVRADQIGNQ